MERKSHTPLVYFTWRFWGKDVAYENFPFVMYGNKQGASIVSANIISHTLDVYSLEKLLSCSKMELKVHSFREEVSVEDYVAYVKSISSEIKKILFNMRKTAPANT